MLRQASLALVALSLLSSAVRAEIVVSAQDGKQVLVDGVPTVPDNPPPDYVAIFDLGSSPPKLVAEVPAPTSVVGPPQSVAVAPDERLALVTSANMIDPADPKKIALNDKLTVIDLQASPPQATGRQGCRRRVDQPRRNACAGCQPGRRDGVGVHDRRQDAHAGWENRVRKR
jgi:hypothetical protein